MSTTRGRLVLVGPSRPSAFVPLFLMMPTDRRTPIVALARSMSDHRSASRSPRRMPVIASTHHAVCSGLFAADHARNADSCPADHGRISGGAACLAVGGLALAGGVRVSRGGSAATAAPRAAPAIVWM